MIGIFKGCPALYCPDTGKCVVVFKKTAMGWSKAIRLCIEISKELRK